MKPEPELSLIAGSAEAKMLANSGVKGQFVLMNWDDAWREVMNIALYKHGADVSEIGAPWTGVLQGMAALRPFAEREITALGGFNAFLPSSWQMTRITDAPGVWAVPFLADATVIYYWRDLLEEAGIDASTAFQTPDRLAETLRKLKVHGIEWPWAVDVLHHWNTLHYVSSWVWQAGGELMDPASQLPTFDSPAALAGANAYFALHPYIAPEARRPENHIRSVDLFIQRKAAVGMGSSDWLHLASPTLSKQPGLLEKIGISLPPGTSYVGAMNLVVWNHTRQAAAAVSLVQQLTSKAVLQAFAPLYGLLPARLDVLNEPPFTNDPRLSVMVESLKTGRTFPNTRGFGLVEQRLSAAFIQIWSEVFSDPLVNSDTIVEHNLSMLNQRLVGILSQF